MSRAGCIMTAGSCLMRPLVVLVMVALVVQNPGVSAKLRGLSLRQGALHLPPLDPELIRGILPPEEISAFSRHTILSRRHLLRQVALNGLPQFGVGPLDPLAVPDMPVNFTMDVVELAGNITNGMVRGLQDLQLLDIDIHLPGLSVAADLRLPLVTLDANYSLDGSFSGLFPLTGAGPLTLKLIDVDVKVIMQARLYYDRLHITRVDFTLAIANTTINLEGFLEESGFGEIAQQFLDGMSGDFLRNFIKAFREERLPSLVMQGNRFLKDFQWRSYLPTFVAIYLGFDDDSGSPYYKDYIPTITNNHLVDRVMRRLSHFLYGRRIGLPAQDIMATKKILFTWWVRTGIQLFKGHLFGAHNLRRVGDTLISRHKEYFTFTIEAVVFNLKAAYKAQLVVLNRPVKFTLWTFISHIKLRVQVQLDAEYMDIYLTGLDVLHIGKIDVKLAGLGPLELVANNLADKQINSDTTKRLLARMVARDARDAIAKQIREVDINSILADTINGDVYARDPGIVFPDPEPKANGTDFSSLLDSVLGADSGDDGGGLGSLLSVLFDDDDSSSSGSFNNTDDIDPETLASLGLDGVDGSNSSATDDDNPLAGLDAETLALFGLTGESGGSDTDATTPASAAAAGGSSGANDPLAGLDADTLALFGLTGESGGSDTDAATPAPAAAAPAAAGGSSSANDPLADLDEETLAMFGLTSAGMSDMLEDVGTGRNAASEASVPAAGPASPSSSGAADPLADVDADTLALFGLSSEPGAEEESPSAPSAPTAAAAELQELLGGDGGTAGQNGLKLENENLDDDSSAGLDDNNSFFDSDTDSAGDPSSEDSEPDSALFDADDNNSFFDSGPTATTAASTKQAGTTDTSLFDLDDNNSFFDTRRRRG
ncbi:uncharacterized protein LOC122364161 [Amphibalanus amphitrite]|uniref:uncharacterized protein LOC122364161 n=1 Tax=Amphibalanus amphitrite TaxID=1232801 RepID=UPI001C8FAC6E|nr:uncharacterized protein LOC122364161 [Amphibalanus amphitrite]